jgi:CheY-like chemotaxis protein
MACIVIAEDQAHIRHVLTMWISRFGHTVVQAGTGVLALEALRTNRADLLITDVNMPEMDGIELTRKAFTACPTLRRVFVVTSRCDQHSILAELSDPRVQVFPKPFSPSQLLKDVEQAIAAPRLTPVAEGAVR